MKIVGLVAGALLAGMALVGLPVGLAIAGDLQGGKHGHRLGEPNRVPAPVVQDYEPAPALWKLSDEDTTIYLFGTFHVLPPSFRWRSPQFDAIVAEADELIVESTDAALEDEEFETALFNLLGDIAARTPTSHKLSPEAAEKWLRIMTESGLPAEALDRLPPMFAMMTLGLDFAYDAGSDVESGVETVLEAEFAAAGKPIGSIEEPLPVLKALFAIDEAVLIDQLEQDLAEWDGESIDSFMMAMEDTQGDVFAAEHAWARGEVLEQDLFGDTALDREMRKVLLTDRNRAWAGWLDARLDRPGVVLVAVGAGHFEGAVSVQAMLAERGLAVQRIN